MITPTMAPRLSVLVVDDEPAMRELIWASLWKLGHSSETAPSAEAALEVFRPTKFDLVITDLYLPGINGHDLAHNIKRQDDKVPIILLTGYAPSAPPSGIDLVLTKPFGMKALNKAIAKVALQTSRRSTNR